MPIRFAISPLLRLSLLLAVWLGAWLCPAPPLPSREGAQQVQAGHSPLEQHPQLTVTPLLEHAALLPAAPDVPVGLSGGALLPVQFNWPGIAWPSAVGLSPALRACAVPDLFRVRLLLTALSPNAP